MLNPAVVLGIGILGIACAGLFVRFAQPAPPVVVGFYRMTLASLVLLAAVALRRMRSSGGGPAISPRGAALALLAGAAFGTDIALWHHAIVRTSIANATLLVNTTPIGTAPGVTQTPIPAASLCGGKTVYDLVYNPGRTRLLREAAAAGCETIGGLDMLVAQAVRQFEWWSKARPSAELFRTAALAALADEGKERSA